MEKSFDLRTRRIEQCLNCAIGHRVIKELVGLIEKRDGEYHVVEDSIAYLSEPLGISCNDKDKAYKAIDALVNGASYYSMSDEDVPHCIASLSQIIVPLREVLYDPADCSYVNKYNPKRTTVLMMMHQLNTKYFSVQQYDTNDADTIFKEMRTQRSKFDTERDQAKKLANLFNQIFEGYCKMPKTIFGEEYPDRNNCQTALFTEAVKSIENENQKTWEKAKTADSLIARAEKLSEQSKEIFHNYLLHAPKEFRRTLQRLIEIHSTDNVKITDQDLVQLLSDDEKTIKVSTIQACFENITPPKDANLLVGLCNYLMVTKEVLLTGTGKVYVFWSSLFSDEGLETIADELETKNKKNKGNYVPATKKRIRDEMKNILVNNDFDFSRLCDEYPDFFKEEEICLYRYEDGLDYKEMATELLHQEEAETLLTVLEKSGL